MATSFFFATTSVSRLFGRFKICTFFHYLLVRQQQKLARAWEKIVLWWESAGSFSFFVNLSTEVLQKLHKQYLLSSLIQQNFTLYQIDSLEWLRITKTSFEFVLFSSFHRRLLTINRPILLKEAAWPPLKNWPFSRRLHVSWPSHVLASSSNILSVRL